MQYRFFFIIIFTLSSYFSFSQKYSARTAHLYIQSANNFANIEADNYQVNSTINVSNGNINVLGLIKSFEFRIGGLDRVFISKLDRVITHPKFKYIGEITNISSVNFNKPGRYPVRFKGILYMWQLVRNTPGEGVIIIHEDGSISAESNLSFKIEPETMDKANKLIKSYLPSSIIVNTDRLGISRDIVVELNGIYRKSRSVSIQTP